MGHNAAAATDRTFQLLSIVIFTAVFHLTRCQESGLNTFIGPPQEGSSVLTIPVIIVPASKHKVLASSNLKADLQASNTFVTAPPALYNRPPSSQNVIQPPQVYDKRFVPNSGATRPNPVYNRPPVANAPAFNYGRQQPSQFTQPPRGYSFNSPVPSGTFGFQKTFGQPPGYSQTFPIPSSSGHGGQVPTNSEVASRPPYSQAPYQPNGYNPATQQASFNKPTGGAPLNFNYGNIPQPPVQYNTAPPPLLTKQTFQSHGTSYFRPSSAGSYTIINSQPSGYNNAVPFNPPQSSPPVAKQANYASSSPNNYRRLPVTVSVSTPLPAYHNPQPPTSNSLFSVQAPSLPRQPSPGYSASHSSPSSYRHQSPSSATSYSTALPISSIVTSGPVNFGNPPSVSSGHVLPAATFTKSFGPSNNHINPAGIKDNVQPAPSPNYGQQGNENDFAVDDYEEGEDEDGGESVSYKVVYIPLELLRSLLSDSERLK